MADTSTKQRADTSSDFEWTDLDRRTVDIVRALAMDSVQSAGNGHPGTAMSLAPAALLLFQRLMRHDPTDATLARPRPLRAVLRALEPDALHPALPQRVRADARRSAPVPVVGQPHSRPSGARSHDRRRDHHWSARPGRRQRGRHGDGRSPRAWPVRPRRRTGHERLRPPHLLHRLRRRHGGGHQQRGLVDCRHPAARQPHAAVRRQSHLDRRQHDHRVQRGHRAAVRARTAGTPSASTGCSTTGGTKRTSLPSTRRTARPEQVTDEPSFIALRTIIAWPAPDAQNTGKAHGSALGAEEVAKTKKVMGLDPAKSFDVPEDVLEHAREVIERGRAAHAEWDRAFPRLARGRTRAGRAVRPDGASVGCPTAGPMRSRRSRPTRREWPRARRPARCSTPSRPSCPSCGADPLTWPSRRTPHPRTSRRSCRRTASRRSSPAGRTGGCCTSGSASTPWARSSTASRCTAAPGRTVRRSSCSATTCARPYAWLR